MLEIKSRYGQWCKVTKEQALNYYTFFCKNAVAIPEWKRHDYFNREKIRGGHVLLNGTVETTEEIEEKVFQIYKKRLMDLNKMHKQVRFICVEYLCGFTKIDPFEMAASLISDGISVVYDDSSISKSENEKKRRKVKKISKSL